MSNDVYERFEVDRLYSVAHLFPNSSGRRGLYVLEFTNGQKYAGQATDVVRRFGQHRRRWQDIAVIQFRRIPAPNDLDEQEKLLIKALDSRGETRNIRHSGLLDDVESDFDLLVTPGERYAWLNSDADLADEPSRVESPGQRDKTSVAYRRLSEHARFPEVAAALRAYVELCVPRPRATELTFWAVSAASSTNASTFPRLAALSINSMEVLVIGHHRHDRNQLWGFVNVSREKARLSPVRNRQRRARHPWFALRPAQYEAAGSDVAAFDFDEPNQLTALLSDSRSQLVTAARELNLRLMRKGPTMQWRWHSPWLADDLLN